MAEQFRIVGEQSIDYLNIKCGNCGAPVTMKYLGWDPAIPHFEMSLAILTNIGRVGGTDPVSRAARRSTAATPLASRIWSFATASAGASPAVSLAQRRILWFTCGIRALAPFSAANFTVGRRSE